MLGLDGRVALVTGADGGMGRAIVAVLRGAGAHVVAADLAFASGASPVDGILQLPCDVTSDRAVETCIEAARAAFGTIDILVNNAGIFPHAGFLESDAALWERVFAVNVHGVARCTRAVLPAMLDAGWGRIVSIGSNTFTMGWPGLAHYVASKGAVVGFTRALAVEVGDRGVTANVVAPTLTPTAGTAPLFGGAPEVAQAILERQAIRRTGRPEDVAAAVLLLASDEAAFITGQTVAADGGLAKLG